MKHPGLIAIDPGCSGGIAWVCSDGIVACDKIPESTGDFVSWLILAKNMFGANQCEVYLEDVPMGMAKGFFGPMAKLQRRAGIAEGAIQALEIRLVMVAPKRWQKVLGLGNRKDYGKGWKNHLKAIAQQRFPHLDVTLATADALLILEYACLQGEK